MRACGSWATERITMPELTSESRLDMALVGASYVRACLDNDRLMAAFTRVLGDVAPVSA